MSVYSLKNVDPEEIEDIFRKVERSFGFRFSDFELSHVKTFGEICDHIISRINLENSEDCTTQQAFYKLRDGIVVCFGLDKSMISPDTKLKEFLPEQARRAGVMQLEKQLGISLNLLRPHHCVTLSLVILFIASLIGIVINWRYGLPGFAVSIFGFWFSQRIGKELELETVGQVAHKLAREQYLRVRRNRGTYNKREIESKLFELFETELGLNKSELTRN